MLSRYVLLMCAMHIPQTQARALSLPPCLMSNAQDLLSLSFAVVAVKMGPYTYCSRCCYGPTHLLCDVRYSQALSSYQHPLSKSYLRWFSFPFQHGIPLHQLYGESWFWYTVCTRDAATVPEMRSLVAFFALPKTHTQPSPYGSTRLLWDMRYWDRVCWHRLCGTEIG